MSDEAATTWAIMRARAALRDCKPGSDFERQQIADIDARLRRELRELRARRWGRGFSGRHGERMRRVYYAKFLERDPLPDGPLTAFVEKTNAAP